MVQILSTEEQLVSSGAQSARDVGKAACPVLGGVGRQSDDGARHPQFESTLPTRHFSWLDLTRNALPLVDRI